MTMKDMCKNLAGFGSTMLSKIAAKHDDTAGETAKPPASEASEAELTASLEETFKGLDLSVPTDETAFKQEVIKGMPAKTTFPWQRSKAEVPPSEVPPAESPVSAAEATTDPVIAPAEAKTKKKTSSPKPSLFHRRVMITPDTLKQGMTKA